MIDPHALRTLARIEAEMRMRLSWPDDVDPDAVKEWADSIAALLSALPETTWQPIETAPKDGTSILVWDEGICIVTSWVEYGGENELAAWWDAGPISPPPTHWMPLPAPPPPSEEPT